MDSSDRASWALARMNRIRVRAQILTFKGAGWNYIVLVCAIISFIFHSKFMRLHEAMMINY